METLRIVQVSHAYPPYVGGLAHVVENLSRHLVGQGHEVEVVTLDPYGRLDDAQDHGGVHVKRFHCLAPSNMYFAPSPKVIPYLRAVEADVVHAHNIGALLAPACWLAVRSRLHEVAFILSPHHHAAGSTWHARMLWRPYRPLAGLVARSAHTVHCVSEFEARLVRDEFSVDPVVVPNGVSEDTFRHRWTPPENQLVLTYAGRLEGYKRVHVLVEAAHILKRRGIEVTLRVIGEGPELSGILASSRRRGVEVEHHPFLPRSDYLCLLSRSSCLVNPSRYEAFSIVVAEALAIGLPVIVSEPWGRTFEGLPNVQVVDGGSPSEVAEAVSKTARIHSWGRSPVSSWSEVTEKIVRMVYQPSLN